MSWFLDKIFGNDEEIERGRKLDAATNALYQGRVDSGVYTQAQYDAYLANASAQSSAGYSQQMEDSFEEGWREGYDNVTGAIRGAIAAPFKFTLDIVPWFVWVIAAVGAAWYLGLIKRDTFAR